MANTICHEGYCESVRGEDTKMTFGNKVAIGSFILGVVAIIGLSLYGISLGYYPDPAVLQ